MYNDKSIKIETYLIHSGSKKYIIQSWTISEIKKEVKFIKSILTIIYQIMIKKTSFFLEDDNYSKS